MTKPKAEAADVRRVKVLGRFRVCHAGHAYSSLNEVVEVPTEVADEWITKGWVEPAE
jgi:hypothetical protein